MSRTRCDVVWFWTGAEWRAADPHCPTWLGGHGGDVDACVDSIERGGRVAIRGLRSIGAPEGPPSAERIAQVLGR